MIGRARKLVPSSLGLSHALMSLSKRVQGLEPEPQRLPTLSTEELATQHLLRAKTTLLQGGQSKSEAFCRMRLLVNQIEQAHGHPSLAEIATEDGPTTQDLLPLPRTIRFLQRAVASAAELADKARFDRN